MELEVIKPVTDKPVEENLDEVPPAVICTWSGNVPFVAP
jgi:hypothetical protein